jgi:hypothetical protein
MSAAPMSPEESRAVFEQLASYAESTANFLQEVLDSGEAESGTEALASAAYSHALIMGALADSAVVRCGGAARRDGGAVAWLAWPRVAAALQTAAKGGQA